MEFLDIEMSKEEQRAFFANQSQKISGIEEALERLTIGLEEYKLMHQLAVQTSKEKTAVDSQYYEDEPRSI